MSQLAYNGLSLSDAQDARGMAAVITKGHPARRVAFAKLRQTPPGLGTSSSEASSAPPDNSTD
jgi:hypothetical protein